MWHCHGFYYGRFVARDFNGSKMRLGVKYLLLQMLNTCFGGRGLFTKAQCLPNYFKDQGMNNWAGITQIYAISFLLLQSINGGKCSGPGLYWAGICAADVFLSPCFLGTVAWSANRTQAGLLCFFLQLPKAEWWSSFGSHSGSESGTVYRGKADGPLLQRFFSFSLQPGCVSSGQDLGKSFHPPIVTSSFLFLFFCSCCSINQLGL